MKSIVLDFENSKKYINIDGIVYARYESRQVINNETIESSMNVEFIHGGEKYFKGEVADKIAKLLFAGGDSK